MPAHIERLYVESYLVLYLSGQILNSPVLYYKEIRFYFSSLLVWMELEMRMNLRSKLNVYAHFF